MMTTQSLDDLCDFINGGAWSEGEYVNSGIPVLKVSNIKPTGFQLDDVSYLSHDRLEKYSQNILLEDDIVIATVGSHPTSPESAAGRSCRITADVAGFLLNQNAVCIRCKDSTILNQRYLGYISESREFRHYIQSRGKGAANQMRIAISSIKEYKIQLPPIQTQRRIADILSAYDDLIENNQRQIKLLEEAAMRLYREWFVFMRFPGHESVRIVDGVPEGWVTAPASELFDITIGRTPSRSEPKWFSTNSDGVKWVSIRDIGDANVFIYNTNECLTQGAVEEFNLNLIPANTVLLSFKLTVGAVAITTENMFTNEAIAHFRTDDERMIEYIYEYLKNFSYESLGNTSSISTAINSKIVKGMVFVLPSKSVLEEFHNLTSPLFQEIRKKSESILHLQKARDALLPRLMNGGVGLKLEEGTV